MSNERLKKSGIWAIKGFQIGIGGDNEPLIFPVDWAERTKIYSLNGIRKLIENEIKKDKDTLSSLLSVLYERDEILRLNPKLNAMYQQSEKEYLQNRTDKASPIDTSASLSEQLQAAYALRNECNSILLSNPKLKQEYIEAKKAYREDIAHQQKPPVLISTASGTTQSKPMQQLKKHGR